MSVINLMPLYEANYRKFMELVPEIDDIDQVIVSGKDQFSMHLRVIERARYTTTLMVTLAPLVDTQHLPNPFLKVRIYHDARVAEVISFQGHSRIMPLYPYPNPHMYHRDEKRQINRFLGEVLDYCLINGCLFPIDAKASA